MKQKIGLGDEVLQTLENSHKTDDTHDDIPIYERRSSNQSNSSAVSNDSKNSDKSVESGSDANDDAEAGPDIEDVKTLTEGLKSLTVEEKKVENNLDRLKSEVNNTNDCDIEDRGPMGRVQGYQRNVPYNNKRSTNLLNGGSLALEVSGSLPVLTDDVLQALPPVEKFSLIQPSPSSTPNSTPNPYNNSVLSPSSGYVSGEFVENSNSLDSRSPIHLPTTIQHSSDEEEKRKDAIHEVRNWMESSQSMKDIKMYEWIQASSKDTVEDLFSELKRLIIRDRRLTDRKFVRIYALIAQILNREGDLKHFFLEEFNFLSSVALKNNPLLFRYIIETIFNLGLNPETIGEPVSNVWNVIIKSKNELNQDIDMTEMLKTLLNLKNRNNAVMFNINEMDVEGYTPIHKILMKMSTNQELATKYFKICLEHQPDFMLTTLRDNRTYMHHALIWGVPPQILDDILSYCATHYSNYNILTELDVENISAENLANNNVLNNREEILGIFDKYKVETIEPSFNTFDISVYLNNLDEFLPDDGVQ